MQLAIKRKIMKMKKIVTAEQAARLGQAQIYAGETLLIAAKRAAASNCDVVINTASNASYPSDPNYHAEVTALSSEEPTIN